MEVREVAVGATYDLRRRVLRQGQDGADVRFDGDDAPAAFHLAVVDGEGRPLAVASVLPSSTNHRPARRTWRLRGMAVEPHLQRQGLGARLLDAVVVEARARDAEALWAVGRDTALGFYACHGWSVEGEGYLAADDLPHHTVVLDLADGATPPSVSVNGDGPGGVAGAAARWAHPTGDEEA